MDLKNLADFLLTSASLQQQREFVIARTRSPMAQHMSKAIKKHNQRQRCTTYTPDSPEVKAMTKQFWQRADQLGKANYYCVCQSCGDSYQLGKEGENCQLCKSGKLYPQDVEPWE